jgi:hypothetical protein
MPPVPHSNSEGDLTAEIAPAMQAKLRRDARLQSLSVGMLTLLLGGIAVRHTGEGFDAVVHTAGILNLVFAAIFFGCALFYPSHLIQMEVVYRRRHGKWRWER